MVSSAGCLNQSSETELSSRPNEGKRMAISVNGPFKDMAVVIEAGYVAGQTEDHPARIKVRLRNEGDEEREFFFGATPPLSTYTGVSSDGEFELVLIPDDTENISIEEANDDEEFRLIPEKPSGDCWRLEDNIIRQDVVQARTLGTNESVSSSYTLLSGRNNDPCLPAKKFTFPATLRIDKKDFNWELVVNTEDQ